MKIAHISDIHFNYGTDFNRKIYEKAVKQLNKISADIVLISGDITTDGLIQEYELAREKLSEIEGRIISVPGNHDERNLGWKLFLEFFGKTDFTVKYDNVTIVALASSEPDKDEGRLGHSRHRIIEEGIKKDKNVIVCFHHHLIPVPNSGGERNIIDDTGETLDIILKNKIPLVLMGHRHVPWAVKIHETLLVNAGTFSCNRTRAHFGNTFNVINFRNNVIELTVVDILNGKKKKMVEFNLEKGFYLNRYY